MTLWDAIPRVRARCVGAVVLALLASGPVRAAEECVDAPVRRAEAGERPANGLPTLGTMLVALGGGTLLGGLFIGAIGVLAAVDMAPRDLVGPLIFLAITASSTVVLVAVLTVVAGMSVYWWGWSLIAAPRDTRPRCPK